MPDSDLDRARRDLQRLGPWLRKMLYGKVAAGTHESIPAIADLFKVSAAAIHQVISEDDEVRRLPSYALLWRLSAVAHEEDELMGMHEDQIKALLFRLILTLGPERLERLAKKSGVHMVEMIDTAEAEYEKRKRKRRLIESRDEE